MYCSTPARRGLCAPLAGPSFGRPRLLSLPWRWSSTSSLCDVSCCPGRGRKIMEVTDEEELQHENPLRDRALISNRSPLSSCRRIIHHTIIHHTPYSLRRNMTPFDPPVEGTGTDMSQPTKLRISINRASASLIE